MEGDDATDDASDELSEPFEPVGRVGIVTAPIAFEAAAPLAAPENEAPPPAPLPLPNALGMRIAGVG